uniref:F-box domain-containing protein n=1 Tax=Triticum urartu TaxID=4572 RepID=A0A8R7PM25_TRIUA
PPPSPAKKPSQLHPTTITTLDDDTLREIFLRLPSLPSLVRAALSCRAFLDAVRSSHAFRRQFRALHPPPPLGLFLGIQDTVSPTFVPLLRRSDPDTAAAVRGADFFLTHLPVSEDDDKWSIGACRDGFVVLDNWSTRQVAVYNPLRRTMDLFPLPPHGDDCEGLHFDYHILAAEEDYRSPYRVVCVWH